MANEIGRPIGASPSTEFVALSAASATAPAIIVTGTAVGGATLIHTADAQATDVLFVQAYNNSTNTVTVYAQVGTTATTTAIPLSLTTKSSGFLINGLPVSKAGLVSVWNDTASSGIVVAGSVQRTYV